MNRRHTFTLSVIAVLGLTLLPGSAISQQTMQMAQSNTNRFVKGGPPVKPNALVDTKARKSTVVPRDHSRSVKDAIRKSLDQKSGMQEHIKTLN